MISYVRHEEKTLTKRLADFLMCHFRHNYQDKDDYYGRVGVYIFSFVFGLMHLTSWPYFIRLRWLPIFSSVIHTIGPNHRSIHDIRTFTCLLG